MEKSSDRIYRIFCHTDSRPHNDNENARVEVAGIFHIVSHHRSIRHLHDGDDEAEDGDTVYNHRNGDNGGVLMMALWA